MVECLSLESQGRSYGIGRNNLLGGELLWLHRLIRLELG